MVKLEVENVVKADTRGLVTVVQVFVAVRNWLGDSGFIGVVCIQGENLMSGLNWLCLIMALLKALF
jgi:hypothetical protein